MQEALSKPCVFGIDDAHWVDSDSWGFLLDLALDPNAILVMTTRLLKKEDKQSAAMLEILNHPHTKVLKLEGLSPDDMVTLACNFINVDSLPEPLPQVIRERSHGVPLWCEELVETMVELQYLQASTYMYMYVHSHVHLHVHVCTFIYMYNVHVWTHIYMYILLYSIHVLCMVC